MSKLLEKMMQNEAFIQIVSYTILAIALPLFIQGPLWLGSHLSNGTGQYTGTIVSAQNHGIIFKTNGIELKTSGYTAKFENFCVLDKDLYSKLAYLPRNKEVTVTFEKRLMSASWQCAYADSNDVITSVRIEDPSIIDSIPK